MIKGSLLRDAGTCYGLPDCPLGLWQYTEWLLCVATGATAECDTALQDFWKVSSVVSSFDSLADSDETYAPI